MNEVFISYHPADSQFAQQLRGKIEAANFVALPGIGSLLSNALWHAGMETAIQSSAAFIVVMSPKARMSEYVTSEWSFAWGAGIPIIPLLLKPLRVLHPRLRSFKPISFATEPYPWQDLLKRLDEVVQQRRISTVPIPRDAPAYVRQAVLALDGPSAEIRRGAVETLADPRNKAGIEALHHALRHPLKDVRIRSAAALARVKITDEAVAREVLEPWFNKTEEFTQEHRDVCVEAIDRSGPDLVPAWLSIYVNTSDQDLHYEAPRAIDRNRDKNAPVVLDHCLNTQNPKPIRLAALQILAEMRYLMAERELEKLLSEPDEEIVTAAKQTIARIDHLASAP